MAILRDAVHAAMARDDRPKLVADAGVENVDPDVVDGLIGAFIG